MVAPKKKGKKKKQGLEDLIPLVAEFVTSGVKLLSEIKRRKRKKPVRKITK